MPFLPQAAPKPKSRQAVQPVEPEAALPSEQTAEPLAEPAQTMAPEAFGVANRCHMLLHAVALRFPNLGHVVLACVALRIVSCFCVRLFSIAGSVS